MNQHICNYCMIDFQPLAKPTWRLIGCHINAIPSNREELMVADRHCTFPLDLMVEAIVDVVRCELMDILSHFREPPERENIHAAKHQCHLHFMDHIYGNN